MKRMCCVLVAAFLAAGTHATVHAQISTWGTGPNQFNIIHSVAVDAKDNIYAGDRNNHRIQVYDDNLNFIKSITGMGAPWGVCIPRADASGQQYIYSSDGTRGEEVASRDR